MMTSEEFTEEIAYYNIAPWGDEWERTSLQASLFFNANKGKHAKSIEPDGFVPKKQERRRQSPAEIGARIKMWAKAYQSNRDSRRG